MTRPKTGPSVNDPERAKALREMRVMRAKLEDSEAGNIRRAVSDVVDGTLPLVHAAKAHCVPVDALRTAARAAGWVSSRSRVAKVVKRRTFGSGGRHA